MTNTQRTLLSIGLLLASLFVIFHFALAAFTTTPLNISKSGTDAGYPAIAVSQNGQNIGIVWANGRSGGNAVNGPIFLKTAIDGATITQAVTVDNSNQLNDQSLTPDVAADPNSQSKMHVVWANLTGTSYTIYYAECSTIGSTCTEKSVQQVSGNETVGDPKVTTSDDGSGVTAVHVVWARTDTPNSKKTVLYSGKGENGSWTSPIVFSDETNEFASHPAIATSTHGGTTYVHVAWASDTGKNDNNNVIKYCRSAVNANGVAANLGSCTPKSFTINDNGSTSDGDHPDYPAVAAITNTVMVLWDELKGTQWPPDETYYAAYNLSDDAGANFDGADHIGNSATARRSDDNPGSATDGSTGIQGSEHGRRLQIKATAELTTTADTDAIIHAVWHQTIQDGTKYYHDVQYNHFSAGGCAECGWGGTENETNGNKLLDSSNRSYSISPDIAVANNELYAVYMEGKTEVGWDVNDSFIFDVIYKGTVVLTDTVTIINSGGVYLPVILKNSS